MSVPFLVILCIFLHNLVCISGANDALIPGEKLSGNQTLVSKGNFFEFGFYTQDNINYFLGIWVKNSSVADGVVWVANTNNPVTNTFLAELSISSEGDLVLTQSQSFIWSSNIVTREPIAGIAILLDNGNLVLENRFNSSQIMWQSFDHPTDTWLPGANLGYDPVTGRDIFLSSGLYSLKYSQKSYYGTVIANVASDLAYSLFFVGNSSGFDVAEYVNGSMSFDYLKGVVAFIKLNNTGYLNFMRWEFVSKSFTTLITRGSSNICDYSLLCENSLCSVIRYKSCGCLSDFVPDSEQSSNNTLLYDWYKQCPQLVDCTKNGIYYGKDEYVSSFTNVVEYPDSYRSQLVDTEEDCQFACSRDCSCIAYYSYKETCKTWHGNFLKLLFPDFSRGQNLLFRVGFGVGFGISVPHIHHKRKIGAIVTVLYILCFMSLLCLIYWGCKRWLLNVRMVRVDEFLTLYSYFFIKKITRNFSDKLGEGGFGVVYKGTFPDSTQVAVKSLKGRVHEEKQFKTEVQTIGMIQHANLVRLLGFCAEGTKRMLVYEYMTNGSLDFHLFTTSPQSMMTWDSRYPVALGTARGLAYLHEECRDCIIHCDIKPENILLDANFCPKIADFGMAKLLDRDYSRALTTMRGTIGYLAPEWISGQPITQKADVYSFGMMLFEIISGKRNREKFQNRECTYFPLYAAIKVSQGEILCLLDHRLEGIANVEELDSVCKVACWCIQDFEGHRPSMGQVVRMLEGVVEVVTPPVPKSLQNLVDIENDSLYSGLD